jgi:flagellar assembly protein FliH
VEMSRIKPFAFDRIFAMPAGIPPAMCVEDLRLQVATLEAEAALMRVDHDAVLAEARAEAFAAGLAQARDEQGAALLSAVDALGCALELTDERVAAITAQLTGDATALALAAADLLAARALGDEPAAAGDAARGRVLEQVARGQELTVRVHPALVDGLEQLMAERRSGDRRRLNLHLDADDGLAIGDAHIEWDGGGLSLDAAARAAAVREELAGLLGR